MSKVRTLAVVAVVLALLGVVWHAGTTSASRAHAAHSGR
jgi:hypothetical protein